MSSCRPSLLWRDSITTSGGYRSSDTRGGRSCITSIVVPQMARRPRRGFLGLVYSYRPTMTHFAKLQYLYRAVAILMLNALIVFACFELAARGVFKMASVISKPTEQLVG